MKEQLIGNYLQRLSPIPVDLVWHENKSSYLISQKERKKLSLRLHRLFLEAPSPVLEALMQYVLKGDKKAQVIVRKMAHLYFETARKEPEELETKGKIYDLQEIYESVKKTLFTPDYHAHIGWSKRARKGSFRHITFGTYDRHLNQIKIHPILDSPEVPKFFIEYIVYHEMLHAICPPILDERGHTRSHTRQFREKERLFPRYEEALIWSKKSLDFFKKRKKRGDDGRS